MGHFLDTDARTARRDQITALLAAGGLEACRDIVLDEISSGPAGTAWCTDLATAIMAAGDLATAAQLADLLARVRRGSARRPARRSNGRALPPLAAPPHQRLSVAKLRHDADQFGLLRRRGLVGSEFDAVIAEYRAVADRLTASGGAAPVPLAGDDAARIAHVYDRIVHVADAPRVTRALTRAWSAAAVEAHLLDDRQAVAVVDDVLTPAAWNGLIRFCQESTVWSDAGGRLEASLFDGFTCALLVQLAGEVRNRFPRLIGTRPLAGIRARKHPPATTTDAHPHTDDRAVDVRFWITPTAANLDPGSGGLFVDDHPAARPSVVPYRGNRAVLLDPSRRHRTDRVHFAAGYEHRRVEIILRYAEPSD